MSMINKEVNEFSVQAYVNNTFKTVSKEDILGKWSVFFFYPADFTFVCPTELGDLANIYDKFQAAECEIYSVSTDTHFVHKAWHDASERIRKIRYPMLADPTHALSKDFDVLIEADGLYAAGDVCVKALRQVVTAVGDGALAATELEKYASALQKKTGLHPEQPQREEKGEQPKAAKTTNTSAGRLFDQAMLAQLNTVFGRMASPLVLKIYLDNRPVSAELKGYMEELASLTDKLTVELSRDGEDAPCVRVCRPDGSWTGLAFHGVPGGHEFTSFVLGLYNAAGPGQPMDEDVRREIREIDRDIDIKVLVSLSCTMCPELVTAAQRIAAENGRVTAQVYDLNHFPEIRDKYKVMSVPCLILGEGETVSFGKKNVRQLLELLKG